MKKCKQSSGFTVLEMLCVLLVVVLVSGGAAMGLRLGVKQYRDSMRTSQSKVLYSTLSTIIEEELRNTTGLTVDENGEVISFFSPNYAKKDAWVSFHSVDENGNETQFGEITVGDKRILGQGAYPEGLTACVDSVSYDSDSGYFSVALSIGIGQEPFYAETFDVLNLYHTVPVVE